MAVNGNANGSADPSALRYQNPRPADEVIEQSLRVPEDLRGQVMVVPFQGLVDWARKNSMWPVTFGLACCAIRPNIAATKRGFSAWLGSTTVTMSKYRPNPGARQAFAAVRYTGFQVNGMPDAAFAGAACSAGWSSEVVC